MKKMNVRKRVIAAALAVCMLPFGTGAYPTVYAADAENVSVTAEAETLEQDTVTQNASSTDADVTGEVLETTEARVEDADTISADDVQQLFSGDTKITEDNKKVEYTDASGKSAVWNGQVFKYTVYGTEITAVEMTYTGTANKNYVMDIYLKNSDGTMQQKGTISVSNSDKLDVKGLIKGQEYYFVVRGYEGIFNTDEYMYTSAADMQDITITIDEAVPELSDLRDSAMEVTPGKSYSRDNIKVHAGGAFDDFGEPFIAVTGLYKITMAGDTQISISYDGGYLAVYEYDDSYGPDGRLLLSNDYEKTNGKCEGVLYCYKNEGKTFYIQTDVSFTLGATEQQPEAVTLQSVKESIPELTKNTFVSVKDMGLTKQILSYEDAYREGIVKRKGYWVKVTVPEDTAYYLSVSNQSNSDKYWKIYTASYYTTDNLNEYFRGENTRDNNTYGYNILFDPGTVNYLCMDANDLANFDISAKKLDKLEAAIPYAAELTETDIENGTVALTRLNKPYIYDCGEDASLPYAAGYGCLLKVKVPGGKAYMFSAEEADCLDITIYEEDCKTITEYGDSNYTVDSIYNQTDEEKTYYVWVDTSRNYMFENKVNISVEEAEVTFSKFDSAEKLEENKTVTYKYDKNDTTYTEKMTNLTVGEKTPMDYAKVYEVEGGAYTLKMHSDADGLNASVYLLNEKSIIEKQMDVQSGDTSMDFYIAKGDKRYIVVAGDAEHLDAQITLTLVDINEDRRIESNINEATEFIVGENPVVSAQMKQYVYYFDRENVVPHYEEKTGTLFKYTLGAKEGILLTAENECEFCLFDEDSKFKSSGWISMDLNYVNVSDESKTIYLLVSAQGDTKLTFAKLGKIAEIKEETDLAIKIPEAGYTTKKADSHLTILSYNTKDGLTYTYEEGGLYSFTVPAKSRASVLTDINGNQDLIGFMRIYDNLDNAPVEAEPVDQFYYNYRAQVDNKTNQEKTYYIWIPYVEPGLRITVTKTAANYPVESITLSAGNADISKIAVGAEVKLTADVMPSGAADKTVTWSSSNTKVATVDATGKVKAIAEGTATITATAKDGSGVTGSLKITVVKPQVEAPKAVTNLSAAAAGKGKVRLTWTKADKADGYLIYAKKNGTYGYCGLANAGTQTSYTDTKAIDTDYNFYWVYPFKYDANGKRVIGKCTKYVYAKGICTATENVKASSVKGGVKLTWSKKAGASGYLIYGKKTGGKYGYIGMTKGYGTTSYTDKSALKGAYNFYWVIPYHYSKSGKLVAGQTGKYVYGRAK